MKKKFLAIGFICAFTALSNAQVGINTDTPSATLDIVSKGNTASTKALELNNSSATEILTVLDNGNTGFNISNPAAKVDIFTSAASTGFRLRDGNQAAGKVLVSDNDGFATWQTVASGGGSGTVTNFSSGNLSPLFTTSVATSSTTPALSFTLSNAPANTVFGNSTATAGAPSYFAASSLPIAGDVTGTLGSTVVSQINGSPLGITIGAATGSVLTFNGTNWSPQTVPSDVTDWKIVGNPASIISSSDALGASYTGGNVLGTLDNSDNLVIVSNGKIGAIIDANGTLKGGSANSVSPFASLTWGNNNTISNTLSSNIALGRSNTVGAQGTNFPGAAIGNSNTVSNGAKAMGNGNIMTNSASIAIGNNNGQTLTAGVPSTAGTGIAIGVSNNMQGGYAFGTGNKVDSNSVAIGISGSTVGAGENVYANTSHLFYAQSNGNNSKVFINLPSSSAATTDADLVVSKAIEIKGTSTAAVSCNASNEGAIRYNSTTKRHEGCDGSTWNNLY
ncbi:hypothetical protein NZ698_13575 [Chryseobacterium sp. PBS4-4]|uniref:Trimeric autotransporter adhesin YadA-like head domain-containing protein n=1 Tax=Chryseobacterium edaphi TaxID=2976532 RepID=A0ABT2W7R0_9FLAO|nr:hypothetical protein [Chryseobacterium edaphi]MCU7618234.1 hypothetical protein [Chryseobacterium edaphi]